MSVRGKNIPQDTDHKDCFACGSGNGNGLGLQFHSGADGCVYGHFLVTPKFQGYSGVLHGGITATLLDSAMIHCLLTQNISALTGKLSIRYHFPIRTGDIVKLEARILDQYHTMFIIEGKASVDGKLVASAEAKYVKPGRFGFFGTV